MFGGFPDKKIPDDISLESSAPQPTLREEQALHPKSLSLGRGTLNLAPLLPGEKGLDVDASLWHGPAKAASQRVG